MIPPKEYDHTDHPKIVAQSNILPKELDVKSCPFCGHKDRYYYDDDWWDENSISYPVFNQYNSLILEKEMVDKIIGENTFLSLLIMLLRMKDLDLSIKWKFDWEK